MRDKLRRVRLFAELSDEELDRLAGFGRLLRLRRKHTVFAEGQPYRGMFVVLSGLAVVYKLSGEGRMLILEVCRPGDAMAEGPLFEERDAGYPAHGRTTRESEILFLPADDFRPFLRRHPEVAWEMLKDFAARLKELSLRLEGVTLREVTSRVARYLLREVGASGVATAGRPVLLLPLTKGSIASYLGTAHETLSRTLAKLIRDKVISVEGNRVTILDTRRLERLI